MPYLKKITIALLGLSLWSCSGPVKKTATDKKSLTDKDQLQQVQWLLGAWQNQMPKVLLCETWQKENDTLFSGQSYFVRNNDTTMLETIRLVARKDGLYYIPTTSRQNDEKPVPFRQTQFSPRHMAFENPEHDYPQKITYTLITADSLVAEISGVSKGKDRRQQFPMHRVR